jgi:2-polyprenyl-6-methoxyphenol hydroxylase-like FAD-dependent oxidoreductase
MSVLISVAGLAGLACSLAFKRLGIKADLIDLAPGIALPE